MGSVVSLTIAVIAVPDHARFLPGLMSNLQKGIGPGDQVVLILSGFSAKCSRKLGLVIPETVCSIRVPHQSAGRNRNIAWSVSSAEVISFHDADDLYHPQRLEAVKRVFRDKSVDAFFHSYSTFEVDEKNPPWQKLSTSVSEVHVGLVTDEEFRHNTLMKPPRDRKLELAHKGRSTNLTFDSPENEFPIHHGHGSFRTHLFPRLGFHEFAEFRNEDGVFARDVLEAGAGIRVSPLRLSAYRQGSTARSLQKPWPFDRGKQIC